MMVIMIIYDYTCTTNVAGWLPRCPFFYFGYVGVFVIFRWGAVDKTMAIVCGS